MADTLPFSEKTSSWTSVLIQGVECGFVNVPLHNIYLSSDLVTGLVAVCIRPSLPFKGVHLPGLKSDVSQHCKSCHTCQMVGKPNQTIPKAHLQPIHAFDEPFSRIIIDRVGPLPKTKSGCQYLLTIMCASTRFPEAIPLRNIKTKTIVKALVKFFTFVGLPRSVQSDQG